MISRTLTIGDTSVTRMGLGTNRITDDEACHTLLRFAVESGVNFIDTAHRYTDGVSEIAIGNALAPYRNGTLVATKGGLYEGGSPEQLRKELDQSLSSLKLERIDLYQLHRVDPETPLEVSVGALKEFHEEGKIAHIGLSNVDVDQLQRAQEIVPIVSVQNEYNVVVRDHEKLVDYCDKNNIVFIPFFPLGGIRGGTHDVQKRVTHVAKAKGITDQQVALAWLLKRSPMILPIPGTLSVGHLKENLAALDVELSDDDYGLLL